MNNTNKKQCVIGQHVLLDLHGVVEVLASDLVQIEKILRQAAHLAHATVLQGYFHSFGEHQGVTGVLLLSESHMSIHTWPEHQLASIDIFMCGQHQIDHAVNYLKTAFLAESHQLTVHERGVLT